MYGIEAFWGKECGVGSRNRADVCLWVTVTGSWLLQITFGWCGPEPKGLTHHLYSSKGHADCPESK